VVTKADRPKGRGKKVLASPVKLIAQELGLNISQPEQIRDNQEFKDEITAIVPDLIVVAAYGKILPLDILNIPVHGSINIHASILPKFRGAAPIHRAILNGEEETGVTLMCMVEGLDEGDILAVSKTEIDSKNTGQLHDELAVMGAELLMGKLDDIEKDIAERIPQDHSQSTYADMINKEEGRLDFNKGAEELERLVRAMTPFPGAFALLDESKVKIIDAEIGHTDSDQVQGSIIGASDNGIEVKAENNSTLIIKKLQMPGKKAMDVASFLRGNSLEKGRLFR
jgi:methionyl-tRNA formyltransferase